MGPRSLRRPGPRARSTPLQRLLFERCPHQGPLAGHRGRQPHLPRGLRGHGLARPGGSLRNRGLHGGKPCGGRRRLQGRSRPVGRDAAGPCCSSRGRPLSGSDREQELRHLLPHDHARVLGAGLLLLRAGDAALGVRRREQRRAPLCRGEPVAAAGPPVLHRARRLRRRLRNPALHRPSAPGARFSRSA